MSRNLQKRTICQRCRRPQRTCLCELVSRINNDIHIQLLQHPKESLHPKGSAILLQLSLENINTWTGEHFPKLQHELSSGEYTDLLLYPGEAEGKSSNDQLDTINTNKPLRLWVLDGTWRKTYKMLQLNPSLLTLPRVNSEQEHSGKYHIRKAPKTDQLSTLEACCYGLAQLENQSEKYDELLSAFEIFNQRWLDFKTSNKKHEP